MRSRILVAFAAMALSLSPALAQQAGTGAGTAGGAAAAGGAGGVAAATGGAQSNPGALGNAYNYTLPPTGPVTCCRDPDDGYDHENAKGNTIAIMTNFNQKLAAMQLAIIEAMRLSTGQLSGNMREQTGADHTLADQQDDRATVKAVEEARLQAIRDAESGASSCRVISGSRGGGLVKTKNAYVKTLVTSLGEFERGEEGPSKDGQTAGILARLQVHCDMFATKADVDAGLCTKKGDVPAGDINVKESLFYKKDNLTSTTPKDRQNATKAFIQNAVAPYSYTPIDATMANTIEGREEASRRNAQQARSSIAAGVMAEAAADRTPSPDKKLTGWAEDMMKNMSGYSDASFPDGMSGHDWLEVYSRGFLLNPDMLTKSDENQVASIKDIKNMTAVQLYQGWEIIQHLERISVTLAAQLAILTEGTRTDIVAPVSAVGAKAGG